MMTQEDLNKLQSLVVDSVEGCVGGDRYYDKQAGTRVRLIGLRFFVPTRAEPDRVIETGFYDEALLQKPLAWEFVASDLRKEIDITERRATVDAAFS